MADEEKLALGVERYGRKDGMQTALNSQQPMVLIERSSQPIAQSVNSPKPPSPPKKG